MPKLIDDSLGPIGAIVSSVLTLAQFQSLYGTGWVLANGDPCPNTSAYYRATSGAANLPNCSGVFLRGSGSQTVGGVTYSAATVGSSQADTMQGHYHALDGSVTAAGGHKHTGGFGGSGSYTNSATSGGAQLGTSGVHDVSPVGDHSHPDTFAVSSPTTNGTHGNPRTGSETRPAHLVVNYFIRIN